MKVVELLHTQDLAQRLTEAEATVDALLSEQIDAVVDAKSRTPVLLSRAQEALRESEERYRRIVETANEGIAMLDTELTLTFANEPLTVETLTRKVREVLDSSCPEEPRCVSGASAAPKLGD